MNPPLPSPPGAPGPSSWRATAAALLIVALALLSAMTLATGCAQVGQLADPTVAQLDRYQQARAAGRWQAIADEPPPAACSGGAPGCARLYAIHGEAQHHLAFDGRAAEAVCPPPAALPRLEAAAASLARSRAATEASTDGSVDAAAQATLRGLRTQVLYCLAENASGLDEGLRRAREADAEAAGLARADALTWQALSRLYLARPGAGSEAQRCQALRSALEAAAQARQAGSSAEQLRLLDRLQHDAGLRRATISGCGG